jgi:hypothetical protein
MNIGMGTKNQSHPSPSVQVTFQLGCHLHCPPKPHLELELSDQFQFPFWCDGFSSLDIKEDALGFLGFAFNIEQQLGIT